MESPGSLTFEVQDVPAIVEACKPQQIYTLIDNTWATPLYFQPLKLGVDISIHSGTKYFGGHSDCFIGAAICNDRAYGKVRTQAINLGQCPGPEDVFLALRGLRTLAVRLEHHQKQALNLAHWLEGQSEVAEVLYPALPSSVDHALWKRDYSGASGLLGFLLKPGYSIQQAEQMINQLQLFGLGASWGGFESLVIGSDPTSYRSKVSWNKPGALIRLHIGFENILDLQSDLARAFECLKGN
jgi:cystathionine beta-lyase